MSCISVKRRQPVSNDHDASHYNCVKDDVKCRLKDAVKWRQNVAKSDVIINCVWTSLSDAKETPTSGANKRR